MNTKIELNGYDYCNDLGKSQSEKVFIINSYIKLSLIVIPILLILALILDKVFSYGICVYIPFLFYILFYITSCVIVFVYISLWSPKCPQCEKRMLHLNIYEGGGYESIYYVCHSCKLYFNSYYQF